MSELIKLAFRPLVIIATFIWMVGRLGLDFVRDSFTGDGYGSGGVVFNVVCLAIASGLGAFGGYWYAGYGGLVVGLIIGLVFLPPILLLAVFVLGEGFFGLMDSIGSFRVLGGILLGILLIAGLIWLVVRFWGVW